MKSGIYAILNTADGKLYVGSAVDFQARWSQHQNQLNAGKHPNRYLQSAWCKYGPDAFCFRVLLYCNEKSTLLWEQLSIDGHKSTLGWAHMYNLSPTAGSTLGVRYSPEVRARMGAPKIGKIPSAETRAKRSESMKGKRNGLGYRHTAEARLAIGKAFKNRKFSDEHKAKLSKANAGRTFSPEHRSNLSKARRAHADALKLKDQGGN